MSAYGAALSEEMRFSEIAAQGASVFMTFGTGATGIAPEIARQASFDAMADLKGYTIAGVIDQHRDHTHQIARGLVAETLRTQLVFAEVEEPRATASPGDAKKNMIERG